LSINPALKDYADELLNSVRITVGEDGIPFIYAMPHPLLSQEIPDKRDWSAVVRPKKESLEKIKALTDVLVKRAMGSDTPEEFWARATSEDGDIYKITQNLFDEQKKLKDQFSQWSINLLNEVTENKQETPSSAEEFRLYDTETRQPTWLSLWGEGLRDLASPAVRPFMGMNDLDSHDAWGHIGTGRGFDRHGEYTNMLAMFSLMDRWAEEEGIPREELLKLKARWFNTFEFSRIDGEFKQPMSEIRQQDNGYIMEFAIGNAFDFATPEELEELLSLIDDGNTHDTGRSKGLASTSPSQLGKIAKTDIVRQSLKSINADNDIRQSGLRSRTEKNNDRDNKVIDVYLNSEMTIQEIAEQEGLSLDTVTGILRQARKRGEISGKRKGGQRGDDRETIPRNRRIIDAYLNTELPMSQIAKQEGLSLDAVTEVLKNARKRGEISDKRKGGPKKRQTVSSGSRDPRSVQEFDKSFEEKYGEEPQYGSGDCFFSAISKAQELADVYDNVRVVHGVPLGTGGEAEGIRYPHAWVEFTQNIGGIDIEFIADFSNGNEVVVPKELYYKIGNIDPEFNRAYSIDEIEEKIEENGHAGPW
jgi:transposase